MLSPSALEDPDWEDTAASMLEQGLAAAAPAAPAAAATAAAAAAAAADPPSALGRLAASVAESLRQQQQL